MPSVCQAVLVHLDSHNKMPQTAGAQTTETAFLTILETRASDVGRTGSSEASPFGLQTAVFFPCLHMPFLHKPMCVGVLTSF